MTDREWWNNVCEDIRVAVFNRLDAEEGINGDEAGAMAAAAERAVREQFERFQSADASSADASDNYLARVAEQLPLTPGTKPDLTR